jgi:1-acyl-sn-glycerol-3-phosphate acyltransferase
MSTAADTSLSHTLWSVWSWFAIGSTLLLGFPVLCVLFVVTAPFDRRRYVTGRAFRLIGVTATWLAPAWDFGVEGDLPEHKPRRTVCVSNHCSAADPFLLSYLPWEMKWLSKTSNFKIPFVGWMLRMAGDVEVVRGDSDSAKSAMARCRTWLERGVPVMIFPEGTRSKEGELLPFKEGAFRLAIESGADILPMAVCGTCTALAKHDWRLRRTQARVRVGEPIATDGLTLDDVDALKAHARDVIEELRGQLRRSPPAS